MMPTHPTPRLIVIHTQFILALLQGGPDGPTQSAHTHPFRARTSGGGIARLEFQLRFGMNLPTKHLF